MADVPGEINYGQVTGRFVTFRADGPDVGDTPDEVPLSGTVTLTPSVNLVRFPTLDPPRIAAISSITAQVVNGDLKAPDGTGELFVIATDQPLGQPDRVQWKATFNLAGATTQPAPVTFNVPAGGVVDLVTVIPAAPAPGTVVVVSSEDRILAEQARDAALQSAQDALAAEESAEQSASDAEASALAASQSASDALNAASRVLQGTGMPNGVVTATPGALYVDTASTNGASIWRKASGTGNTGWSVVEGDTGVRAVTPLNGWTTSTGALTLRRDGGFVTLAGYLVRGTDPHAYTVPTGFRIAANTVPVVPYGVGTPSPVQAVEMLTSGTVRVLGTSTGTHYFAVTYPTKDPWPTVLPGTPA